MFLTPCIMRRILKPISLLIFTIVLSGCKDALFSILALALIFSDGDNEPDGYTVTQNTPPLAVNESSPSSLSNETATLTGRIFSGNDAKEWLYCRDTSPSSGVVVTWTNTTNNSTGIAESILHSNYHGCSGDWVARDISLEWGDNEILLLAAGGSGNSKQLTTTVRRAPARPKEVNATIFGNDVTITWLDDVPYATSYNIIYSTSALTTADTLGRRITHVTSPYTFSLPKTNTTYHLYVTAVHKGVSGVLSKEIILTTGWYSYSLNDLVNQDDTGIPQIKADNYDHIHIITDNSYINNTLGYWVDVPLGSNDYKPIALDTDVNGRAHLLLKTSTELLYAHQNTSMSWVTTSIDSIKGISDVLLAIDTQDHAHIVFNKYADLIYGTNKSGQWVYNSIDTDPSIIIADTSDTFIYNNERYLDINALSVDSVGNAHLTYVTKGDAHSSGTSIDPSEAWYANNTSGTWKNMLITDSKPTRAVVAVDSTDTVHIVYSSGVYPKYTKHTPNNGNQWSTAEIILSPLLWYALDTDNNGRVHIAGYWVYGELMYINNINTEFNSHTLLKPTTTNYRQIVDISVDSYGKAHITYSDLGYLGTNYVIRPYYLTNKIQ